MSDEEIQLRLLEIANEITEHLPSEVRYDELLKKFTFLRGIIFGY